MARVGRNDPCPCGSGRKAKRCCGIQRGPSEEQLGRAALAQLGRDAAWDLAGVSDVELEELLEDVTELPAVDLSLQARLPDLVSPDLQRLRDAVAGDDPDWDLLATVTRQVDTPRERLRLAQAVIDMRDQGRIARKVAAAALLELSSSSDHLLACSVLEAVAVSVGIARTPAGLQIAA